MQGKRRGRQTKRACASFRLSTCHSGSPYQPRPGRSVFHRTLVAFRPLYLDTFQGLSLICWRPQRGKTGEPQRSRSCRLSHRFSRKSLSYPTAVRGLLPLQSPAPLLFLRGYKRYNLIKRNVSSSMLKRVWHQFTLLSEYQGSPSDSATRSSSSCLWPQGCQAAGLIQWMIPPFRDFPPM